MKLEELTESERREVMDEARKVVTAELDVKAKDDRIKELEEAAESDKAKMTGLEKQINEAKSEKLIEAAFPEDLPDCARARLREALKGETDEKKIAEAVKVEADYVATVTEAGKVKGMGGGAADEKRKDFVESAVNEIAEATGIKKEADKK